VMGPLLPPAILRQPKRGFMVPLARWLRGPLAEMAGALLSEPGLRRRGLLAFPPVRQLVADHHAGRRSHADRLFALMMLELWQRAFWDEWPARRRAVFAEVDRAPGGGSRG